MTEFIGRGSGGRPYSYPETPRGGGLAALARNYAVGPSDPQAIAAAGTQITWGTVDVAGFTFNDVPITPHVSGRVRVRASIGVQNTSNNPVTVIVEVQVDGVTYPVPAHEEFTVPASSGPEDDGFVQIPVLTTLTGLALGTSVNVQINMIALTDAVLELTTNNSTLELEEVLPSTG